MLRKCVSIYVYIHIYIYMFIYIYIHISISNVSYNESDQWLKKTIYLYTYLLHVGNIYLHNLYEVLNLTKF